MLKLMLNNKRDKMFKKWIVDFKQFREFVN